MMYCSSCGSESSDAACFCQKCGKPLRQNPPGNASSLPEALGTKREDEPMTCPYCQREIAAQYNFCHYCGSGLSVGAAQWNSRVDVRRLLRYVLSGVGIFSFFLPLVSVHAPIFGDVSQSAYDYISEMASSSGAQPLSLHSIVQNVASAQFPFGVLQFTLFPFAVAVAYILLISLGIAELGESSQNLKEGLSAAGLVTSLYALLSVLVFNSSFHAWMMDTARTAGPGDLTVGMVATMRFSPQAGLYLLVVTMILLVVMLRLAPERFSV
jgi:Double zinc ribbon